MTFRLNLTSRVSWPKNLSFILILISKYSALASITDQYGYEMLRKFGSQLNIKNQLIEFPTIGQNKTKCKLNLEIKGKTISIVRELFFPALVPLLFLCEIIS